MDLQTILGLAARHALTAFAGILITHGYLSSSATEQFVAAGMLFLGIAASWWDKRGRALLEEEIARLRKLATIQARMSAQGMTAPIPAAGTQGKP